MTTLDLRLKYKATTGFAPTYGRTSLSYQGSSCNYRGGLTQKYAEWIEEVLFMGKDMRLVYKLQTGDNAIRKEGREVIFLKPYKEFLEEEFLRIYNETIK